MNTRFASISLLWLVAFTAAATVENSFDLTDTRSAESKLASISLLLYTGQTIDEHTTVSIDDALNLLPILDPAKPTVFYIFGWTEDPASSSVATIVGAYLERQDHNTILINWEELAAESYPTAASSAKSIGTTVANALNDLVEAGLDPKTLHIVSHSLGSQIAGFIGRNTNFKLPRITGLDPAGPGFNIVIEGLTSNDAEFVDVIHSDGGVYGTASVRATVNFYPNGGRRFQPGCPAVRQPMSDSDFCDHHRSWHYYAESLLNEDAFMGVECCSYIFFQLGWCSLNAEVVMGYAASTTASGKVYLQTNGESPFGRGKAGEDYEDLIPETLRPNSRRAAVR